MSADSRIDEILSRTRRIETRVTQALVAMGIDTNQQKPTWGKRPGEHPTIELPSPHSSMKEILEAVPTGYSGHVKVLLGDRVLTTLAI